MRGKARSGEQMGESTATASTQAAAGRVAAYVFHASGALATVTFSLLAWQSQQQEPMALTVFAALCAVAFLCSLTACWGAAQSAGRVTLRHLLAWCVVLRAVGVLGAPIYEDDYYRYLWDGRQSVEQGTPYGPPPAAAFDTEQDPLWSDVLDHINNPQLPTIYGPVNQYAFALAYWIAPGDVTALQVIFAVVDLLVIVLLARMAALAPLVLYGFSPLVLKEFAFTAHPDILSVFALLLGTLLWRRQHLYAAGAALAVAVGAKLFALLLVPLLLRWCWGAWLVFGVVTVLLYLPFGNPLAMSDALAAMGGGGWLFNAPVYYLLYQYVDLQLIKGALLLALVALCGGYFFAAGYLRERPPRVPRADGLYMAMLIASPAFNPWYYVFVLVFAVIHPSAWAWVGSLTILCAYATGLQLGTETLDLYQQPAWSLIGAFAPIVLAAVIARWRRHPRAT